MQETIERKRMAARPNIQPLAKRDVPPLENGDHLTQKEFHRRYLAMPGVHAELIEGIVYMSSPDQKFHGRPLSLIHTLIGSYEWETPGLEAYINTSVILDNKNEVRPDASLSIMPSFGGRGSDIEKYFNASPELVVEVANTSASKDLNAKMEAYRKNNAQEYLVHLVRDKRVNWFGLKNGVYVPILPDGKGIVRSEVFPGLWLNTRALFERDKIGLKKTLAEGLASPEYAAFCAKLDDAAKKLKRKN